MALATRTPLQPVQNQVTALTQQSYQQLYQRVNTLQQRFPQQSPLVFGSFAFVKKDNEYEVRYNNNPIGVLGENGFTLANDRKPLSSGVKQELASVNTVLGSVSSQLLNNGQTPTAQQTTADVGQNFSPYGYLTELIERILQVISKYINEDQARLDNQKQVSQGGGGGGSRETGQEPIQNLEIGQ